MKDDIDLVATAPDGSEDVLDAVDRLMNSDEFAVLDSALAHRHRKSFTLTKPRGVSRGITVRGVKVG